ncbi:MAG: DUF1214 domain-containing protein [Pseudomonadota bacterium]
MTLERGLQFNTVDVGLWEAWPVAGEPTADPYSKALFARIGSVWMSSTEGLALVAKTDTDGAGLTGQCRYRISGVVPRGRLWTLTATATEPRQPELDSYLTSDDVIWDEDQSLTVTISARVFPGNWLPVSEETNRFELVLRIYDTPLASGGLDDTVRPPVIEREVCL